MTLQDALALVQKQFVAEVTPSGADQAAENAPDDAAKAETRAAYDEALKTHPCAMAVAHQLWGNELTRQNLARAAAAAQQARAQQQGGANPAGGAGGSNFMAPPRG